MKYKQLNDITQLYFDWILAISLNKRLCLNGAKNALKQYYKDHDTCVEKMQNRWTHLKQKL
jgi:hypothetical protein